MSVHALLTDDGDFPAQPYDRTGCGQGISEDRPSRALALPEHCEPFFGENHCPQGAAPGKDQSGTHGLRLQGIPGHERSHPGYRLSRHSCVRQPAPDKAWIQPEEAGKKELSSASLLRGRDLGLHWGSPPPWKLHKPPCQRISEGDAPQGVWGGQEKVEGG